MTFLLDSATDSRVKLGCGGYAQRVPPDAKSQAKMLVLLIKEVEGSKEAVCDIVVFVAPSGQLATMSLSSFLHFLEEFRLGREALEITTVSISTLNFYGGAKI